MDWASCTVSEQCFTAFSLFQEAPKYEDVMGLGTALTDYKEYPYSQEKAALLEQDYTEGIPLPDIVSPYSVGLKYFLCKI